MKASTWRFSAGGSVSRAQAAAEPAFRSRRPATRSLQPEQIVGADAERPGEQRHQLGGRVLRLALVVGDHALRDAELLAELLSGCSRPRRAGERAALRTSPSNLQRWCAWAFLSPAAEECTAAFQVAPSPRPNLAASPGTKSVVTVDRAGELRQGARRRPAVPQAVTSHASVTGAGTHARPRSCR